MGANTVAKPKGTGLWGLIKKILHRYFVEAMSAMALGLFASLLIGLILGQFAKIPGLEMLTDMLTVVSASSPVVGAIIGVSVAWGLKAKPLAMFSAGVAGAIGYAAGNGTYTGGPIGAYIAACVGAELGSFLTGKTKVDIVVVPSVTVLCGGLVGTWLGPIIGGFMESLGAFIMWATELYPIPMGAIVSGAMGMVLTAPISSAALAITLGLSGLAAGAATVGCCTQMVGFAVASWRENKFSGLLAQGIGTSMLQFGNIMRRPLIWIPPTLASVILGPLSTTIFAMENTPMGAGMGTSGLVGQFGTWDAMIATTEPWLLIVKMLVLHIVLPAVLTLAISEGMRKIGWIRVGDMRIENL